MGRRGRGCSQQINITPTAKPGTQCIENIQYTSKQANIMYSIHPDPGCCCCHGRGGNPGYVITTNPVTSVSRSQHHQEQHTSSHLHHRPLLLKYFSKLKISPQIWWRVFNQECYRYLTAVPPPWTWYQII